MKAYSDFYLPYVSESLGVMFELAVKQGVDPICFWNTFIVSYVAKQIEEGNPKYLSLSGIDYLDEIYKGKKEKFTNKKIEFNHFYWSGWILACFQQRTGYSFFKINEHLPIEEVFRLYPALHEADVTKFYAIACSFFKKDKKTKLRKMREANALSQSQLAKLADVDLRSIQMYEQRRNDINKAQAMTLFKLSKTLNCRIEDLLEEDEK